MAKVEPEEEHPLLGANRDNNDEDSQAENPVPDHSGHPARPEESNAETPPVSDSRFNPPPPSPWKRVALIGFIIFLFFCAFQLRATLSRDQKPKVIYASRYSKEYKFRPAASPVITEHLKDGRVRLRGAYPPPTETPTPTTTAAKRRRSKANKKSKKKRSSAAARG